MRSKANQLHLWFHQRHLTSFSWLYTILKSAESSSYWSAAPELTVVESTLSYLIPHAEQVSSKVTAGVQKMGSFKKYDFY